VAAEPSAARCEVQAARRPGSGSHWQTVTSGFCEQL
jgi:hypothetical protein